jgi:hypothetical protein
MGMSKMLLCRRCTALSRTCIGRPWSAVRGISVMATLVLSVRARAESVLEESVLDVLRFVLITVATVAAESVRTCACACEWLGCTIVFGGWGW